MTQIPEGPKDLYCPFMPPEVKETLIKRVLSAIGGFEIKRNERRRPMSETCKTCPMWQQFRGVNPNDGKEVDEWRCAVSTLPMLMIETSSQVRQGAAATESFRNEMVSRADEARKQRIASTYQTNQLLIDDT